MIQSIYNFVAERNLATRYENTDPTRRLSGSFAAMFTTRNWHEHDLFGFRGCYYIRFIIDARCRFRRQSEVSTVFLINQLQGSRKQSIKVMVFLKQYELIN